MISSGTTLPDHNFTRHNGVPSAGYRKSLLFSRTTTSRSHLRLARRNHSLPFRARPSAFALFLYQHPGLIGVLPLLFSCLVEYRWNTKFLAFLLFFALCVVELQIMASQLCRFVFQSRRGLGQVPGRFIRLARYRLRQAVQNLREEEEITHSLSPQRPLPPYQIPSRVDGGFFDLDRLLSTLYR